MRPRHYVQPRLAPRRPAKRRQAYVLCCHAAGGNEPGRYDFRMYQYHCTARDKYKDSKFMTLFAAQTVSCTEFYSRSHVECEDFVKNIAASLKLRTTPSSIPATVTYQKLMHLTHSHAQMKDVRYRRHICRNNHHAKRARVTADGWKRVKLEPLPPRFPPSGHAGNWSTEVPISALML